VPINTVSNGSLESLNKVSTTNELYNRESSPRIAATI